MHYGLASLVLLMPMFVALVALHIAAVGAVLVCPFRAKR